MERSDLHEFPLTFQKLYFFEPHFAVGFRLEVATGKVNKRLGEERQMEYLLSYHTDAGRVKKVNQDSLLLQSAWF